MNANKQRRIVVVDDHGVVRLGLVALLSQQPGLTVVGQATNADEALDQVAKTHPDLVILDVKLPGRDGVEACRELRSQFPSVDVIMLSSFAEPHTVAGAFMAGAKGYVLKDLENHALLEAIQKVAAGGSALDPSLGGALATGMHAIVQKQIQPSEPTEPALTKQETAILRLVARGLTNREIGQELFLSDKTVRNYLSELMQRHHLSNRAEAAAFAVQKGLLSQRETAR